MHPRRSEEQKLLSLLKFLLMIKPRPPKVVGREVTGPRRGALILHSSLWWDGQVPQTASVKPVNSLVKMYFAISPLPRLPVLTWASPHCFPYVLVSR